MADAKSLLVVIGTRPELIKLAPIVSAAAKHLPRFDCRVCLTGQHRDLIDPLIDFFGVPVGRDLDIMVENQNLTYITKAVLDGVGDEIDSYQPDAVVVQGDTTSAFAGALAAFYRQVPVAHVEAGLRTDQKYSPFPEEMNRCLIDQMATFKFAPTKLTFDRLVSEGLQDGSHMVGNTVVDAVMAAVEKANSEGRPLPVKEDILDNMVLLTAHRRENFGTPFERICQAVLTILDRSPELQVVYPVHPNPSVSASARRLLGDHPRVHLIAAAEYVDHVRLMAHARVILTDSGGIQEEAPSVGTPVVVLREHTERWEGISAEVAFLVGTDERRIVETTLKLLSEEQMCKKATPMNANPYGDGRSAERILTILNKSLSKHSAWALKSA